MILICSKEDDPHTVKVAANLASRGEKYFIFDTSTFPSSLSLTGSFGNGSSDIVLQTLSGENIRLPDIKSFWWRRPQPMGIDPRIEDPQARAFAFQECVSALYGTLECCEALWVNDISRDTT